jgi:hypothetical protein
MISEEHVPIDCSQNTPVFANVNWFFAMAFPHGALEILPSVLEECPGLLSFNKLLSSACKGGAGSSSLQKQSCTSSSPCNISKHFGSHLASELHQIEEKLSTLKFKRWEKT